MKAWRRREDGSFLWKHETNEHSEGGLGEGDIQMKVIGKPRKALQRQVEEAVRIEVEKEGDLMNSKKGYGNNKIPRIRIAMGEDVRGNRSEWERERVKKEEKAERERERVKREEHQVWEEGGECVWETQEDKKKMEIWDKEKMGSARTRGRYERETKGGWWGPKRWGRRMCGMVGSDSGATQGGGRE